jgi:hypothetical protein
VGSDNESETGPNGLSDASATPALGTREQFSRNAYLDLADRFHVGKLPCRWPASDLASAANFPLKALGPQK